MSATTLEGRLLCASASAYATVAGENLLDPQAAVPYYAGAGFSAAQPPTVIQGGQDDIDACLVGQTEDGLVVAFRGTLPLDGPFTLPKLLDWMNDLNAMPVAGDGLPGQVHQGFLGSVNSLWTNLRDEVKKQLAQMGATTRLFITGHSKGGGMAPLAAMRLLNQEALTAKVVTFAAPKPGNKDFADAYNAVMDHTRYEFGEDAVPHLPSSGDFLGVIGQLPFFSKRLSNLSQFAYERVGSLLYIPRSLEIVPDPQNTLLSERRRRLASLILTGQIQQIGDDHRCGCGYGYMTALCPTSVCPTPL
jgi:Lipase (class 3)